MRQYLPGRCLMLVTEPMERCRHVDVVCSAVAGGVDIVQIRDKRATLDEMLEMAAMLKSVLPTTPFIINGFPSVARTVNARGVHLPESCVELREVRQMVGDKLLVGRSVHSKTAAAQAESAGADYLVAGTVFQSTSHPDLAPSGLNMLRAVCSTVQIPVIAIGGITPETAGACMEAGAAGVAVLSAILHAPDPGAAAARYRYALDQITRNRDGSYSQR